MKTKAIAALAFIILLFVSGCAGNQITGNPVKESRPMKIGVVAAQTGGVSAISIPSQRAIQMALADYNAKHLQQFEVIFEDNAASARNSVFAFKKLVEVDGVSAVIGDITTTTMSVAPLANEMRIPLVSYITTSPVAREKGEFAFRTSPMNLEGMKMTAEFMIDKGMGEVSLITELNDYPISLKESFAEEFKRLGGKVIHDDEFQKTDDLRTMVLKADSKEPDAIMLFVISPSTAVNVLKQIRELGIDTPLFGSENAASDMALRIGGDELLEDMIFASPMYNTERMESLKERYLAEFDNDVLDWLYVATGYDAATVLFTAMDEVGDDPEAIRDFLDEMEGFEGVSGDITFDEFGDPSETDYGLFKIIDGTKVRIG